MKQYIESILPKLKMFSDRLSNIALFADHPWVQVDDSNDRRVYVFRSKEHELLVSINGNVSVFRWEYLEHMNSLLIETGESKTLYNLGFLDEAVLILKKDGETEFMMLVNESKIFEIGQDKVLDTLEQKYLKTPQSVHTDPRTQERLDVNELQAHKRELILIAIIVIIIIAIWAMGS